MPARNLIQFACLPTMAHSAKTMTFIKSHKRLTRLLSLAVVLSLGMTLNLSLAEAQILDHGHVDHG